MVALVLVIIIGVANWYLLAEVEHWLAHAFAGVLMGVLLAIFYTTANVRQTAEFWRRTCPRWMLILFGPPMRKDLEPILVNHKFFKGWMIFSGVSSTIAFILMAISDVSYIVLVVTFVITWIPGIVLSERYFKRRFTRIKDWSEILNSQD